MDREVHLLALGAAIDLELVAVHVVSARIVVTHHGERGFATGLKIERDGATADLLEIRDLHRVRSRLGDFQDLETRGRARQNGERTEKWENRDVLEQTQCESR